MMCEVNVYIKDIVVFSLMIVEHRSDLWSG